MFDENAEISSTGTLTQDYVDQTLRDPQVFLKAVRELQNMSSQGRVPYPDPAQFIRTVYGGFQSFPARLKNYNLAKGEKRGSLRKAFPYVVDFEPVSRCNYRCTMCQVSEWHRGKRAEDMTLDEVFRMQSLWPYVVELKLHGMGEPLLHKDFFRMLKYFDEWKIWTRTSTNGSLLYREDIRHSVLDSNLGEMQISIDGASSRVYEKIRVRGKFAQVIQGCAALNEELNRRSRLLTRMWVLVQNDNLHELRDFAKLAVDLGFRRLTFSLSLNDWGQQKWQSINSDKQVKTPSTEEKVLELQEEFRGSTLEITVWRQSEHYSTSSADKLCPWIFDRTYICSDSRTTPCAIIGNPDVVDLGSATDFSDTWNGSRYVAFRDAHIQGEIPRECNSCYGTNPIAPQTFVDLPTPKALRGSEL